MGTMKESYEQMEMKRLAAQRKKEKAQAIKDKERVRQQVRPVRSDTQVRYYHPCPSPILFFVISICSIHRSCLLSTYKRAKTFRFMF